MIEGGDSRPLQPLPIPIETLMDVSMDFVEGLLPLRSKTTILIVVDFLTPCAHFSIVVHPYATSSIAQIFVDNIVKLHGIPQSIVNDRDKIFTSNFWKEFFFLQVPS